MGSHTRQRPRFVTRGSAIVAAIVMTVGLTTAANIIAPAYACACGAFAPQEGAERAQLSAEQAIISWANGIERVDMALDLETFTAETGLLIPTPTPAEVTIGDKRDFVALSNEMVPEQRTVYDWWTWPGWDTREGAAKSGADPGAPATPVVISQVQLGPLEATVLQADDPAGLRRWLNDNNFGISNDVAALFPHYVQRGWSYIALKLTGDVPLDGTIDPLRFAFQTDKLVYPMMFSQAATDRQTVSLYVLTDHKQDISFVGRQPLANDVVWAREVRDPNLRARGAYLTTFVQQFDHPRQQIMDDFTFTPSRNDSPVGAYTTVVQAVTFIGMPAGWLLVAVVIAILAGAVFLSAVRSARR